MQFTFTKDELEQLAYEIGGAATRPLLEDNPNYTFPAEKVGEAVSQLLVINLGASFEKERF